MLPALFALCFSGTVIAADPLQRSEALQLLQKIADAARELNYTGTFVYQHGDQSETSRIAHFVESGKEYEKLITLRDQGILTEQEFQAALGRLLSK